MIIRGTDYALPDNGLKTHQPIMVCTSGSLYFPYQGKEREISLYIDDGICIIKEDDVLKEMITAPFHIVMVEGKKPDKK